jgi:hypothetical protein
MAIRTVNRQTNPPNAAQKYKAQQHDFRAFAQWNLTSSYPVNYSGDGTLLGPYAANDANDPNTTAPADSRVISCGQTFATISHIAIWPVITQALELHVWGKTGLTTAGAKWVRIAKVTFAGTTADLETFVPTGYRDVFIQVVSGADGGHPVTLAVAAC